MVSKMYPTRKLGTNGPTVSAIGFGALGKAPFSDPGHMTHLITYGDHARLGLGVQYGQDDSQEVFKTLTYAADRGLTFWDTADMYGDSESAVQVLP